MPGSTTITKKQIKISDLSPAQRAHFDNLRACHVDLMQFTPTKWKAETKLGMTKPRSNALQSVDAELQNYHNESLSSGNDTILQRI
jgi:hypothetical protein